MVTTIDFFERVNFCHFILYEVVYIKNNITFSYFLTVIYLNKVEEEENIRGVNS